MFIICIQKKPIKKANFMILSKITFNSMIIWVAIYGDTIFKFLKLRLEVGLRLGLKLEFWLGLYFKKSKNRNKP